MGKVTKKAMDGLIKKLGLPYPYDEDSQDWEIEIADSDLALKTLENYISRNDLDTDEKFTLMIIILESVNQYISEHKRTFPKIKLLQTLLLEDYLLHKETLKYYACFDIDLEYAFDLTPFARLVIKLKLHPSEEWH